MSQCCLATRLWSRKVHIYFVSAGRFADYTFNGLGLQELKTIQTPDTRLT